MKIINNFFVALFILLLVSCATNKNVNEAPQEVQSVKEEKGVSKTKRDARVGVATGATVGAVAGGSYGASVGATTGVILSVACMVVSFGLGTPACIGGGVAIGSAVGGVSGAVIGGGAGAAVGGGAGAAVGAVSDSMDKK